VTTPSTPWFVYVARCADGSLYAGIALDVAARIAAHDAGRGARYTRGRGPLKVLVTRRCRCKGDALRLELAIKRLTRDAKLALASSPRRLARLARDARGEPKKRQELQIEPRRRP
jgi:putative endonuclease